MFEADGSGLGRLLVQLVEVISGENDGTMSRAEAEAYRLDIMEERTAFVRASDSGYFGTTGVRSESTFFPCWSPRPELKLRTLVVVLRGD
jgi:hypothetical protein